MLLPKDVNGERELGKETPRDEAFLRQAKIDGWKSNDDKNPKGK